MTTEPFLFAPLSTSVKKRAVEADLPPRDRVHDRAHDRAHDREGGKKAAAEKQCAQAIHSFCLQCQGRLALAVKNCEDTACALYSCRMGALARAEKFETTNECEALARAEKFETTNEGGEPDPLKSKRPLRVARRFCLDCCAGERKEVRLCKDSACKMWPFRLGVSPLSRKKLEKMWWEPRQLTLPF